MLPPKGGARTRGKRSHRSGRGAIQHLLHAGRKRASITAASMCCMIRDHERPGGGRECCRHCGHRGGAAHGPRDPPRAPAPPRALRDQLRPHGFAAASSSSASRRRRALRLGRVRGLGGAALQLRDGRDRPARHPRLLRPGPPGRGAREPRRPRRGASPASRAIPWRRPAWSWPSWTSWRACAESRCPRCIGRHARRASRSASAWASSRPLDALHARVDRYLGARLPAHQDQDQAGLGRGRGGGGAASGIPDILLSADANAAYTLADADHLQALDDFDLLMIEQPLDHDDLDRPRGAAGGP